MRTAAVLLLLVACSNTVEPPPPPGTPALHLVTNLFSSPVFATAPPGDTLRLFAIGRASCRERVCLGV